MPERLDVLKTYKLFIDGKFPRSESGRSIEVKDRKGSVVAHASHASRKDLREAVEAARRAFPGWSGSSALLRGQILYRAAEMMEGKRAELAQALTAGRGSTGSRQAQAEVSLAVDRLVHFAGWADKFSQVLGCHNAVAGPYYNFTFAEPTGVVCVVCPPVPPLLSLISLLAPVLCSGNTAVVIADAADPLSAAVLAEVIATSDFPAGVCNILTGDLDELVPFVATHRDIDGVHAAGLSGDLAKTLRAGVAENIKRTVVHSEVEWDSAACESPWWIEPFLEMKTVWHPASA
ncbi:MAG: aldehyde dehydrogenase family protein [Leptolyngbya sp. PLA1]|nr:aldehyde dehydrogenase family protein [Leptolyngbya sp. PLA1]